MRKKHVIRDNIPVIIVTSIISMIGSLSIGYANNILYAGNEVSYDNSVSGLNSTTVQGALDEMCTVADFSDRVSALESHFDSTSTTFVGANFIDISSPNASSGRGLRVKDDNGKSRGYFYYDPSTDTTIIDARNSSQSAGAGTLNIKGSPVKINGVTVNSLPKLETLYNKTVYTTSTSYQKIGEFQCSDNAIVLFHAAYNNATVSGIKITLKTNTGVILYIDETGSHDKNGMFFCEGTTSMNIYAKNGTANANNQLTVKKITF